MPELRQVQWRKQEQTEMSLDQDSTPASWWEQQELVRRV